MGGGDEKSNLTVLTGREHFLVHLILASKLHDYNRGLWNAVNNMVHTKSKGQDRYIPSARVYEYVRSELAVIFSGNGNGFYGKQHTIENKMKHSQFMTGRFVGEKNAFYGKKHSEETLLKTRKTNIEKGAFKSVVHVESNMVFETILETNKYFNFSYYQFHKQLKLGKFKYLFDHVK